MKKVRIVDAVLLPVLFAVLTSGCAAGNKITYHDLAPGLTATGSKAVAVATHDQRPYVVEGNKLPNFVGLQRSGFGIPYNVTTASGKPLAEDMTATMSSSLSKNGFKTIPVMVLFSDNQAAVVEKLKNAGGDALALLTLNEWKSDTLTNVALYYDMNLKVYSKDGSQLAEKQLVGKDDLGGSGWAPVGHSKKAVPEAFTKKIEELFNDPEVVKALQ